MAPETDIYFRDLFRQARLVAYQDAEGFQEIFFALEKFGAYLALKQRGADEAKKIVGLANLKPFIAVVATKSPLHSYIPDGWREYHLPFSYLYELVREARNDALHQGAYARHLTDHAVQLSLIIEDALMDALMKDANMISDYMVRGVISAELWQPVSFVRQQMLANSFSYLPLRKGNDWYLLSDSSIAKYIREKNRKERLVKSVKEALDEGLEKESVECFNPATPSSKAIKRFSGKPLLVVDKENNDILLGIITAFDLL